MLEFLVAIIHGCICYRSSANPKKVEALDGMHVTRWVFENPFSLTSLLSISFGGFIWVSFCSVACGLGFSLIVVDRTNVADRLEQVLFSNLKDSFHCMCYFILTFSLFIFKSFKFLNIQFKDIILRSRILGKDQTSWQNSLRLPELVYILWD